jgi:hypothetical protein
MVATARLEHHNSGTGREFAGFVLNVPLSSAISR